MLAVFSEMCSATYTCRTIQPHKLKWTASKFRCFKRFQCYFTSQRQVLSSSRVNADVLSHCSNVFHRFPCDMIEICKDVLLRLWGLITVVHCELHEHDQITPTLGSFNDLSQSKRVAGGALSVLLTDAGIYTLKCCTSAVHLRKASHAHHYSLLTRSHKAPGITATSFVSYRGQKKLIKN